jgi:chromosome segregation ATPase
MSNIRPFQKRLLLKKFKRAFGMENPAEVQEIQNKLRMKTLPQEQVLNAIRRQQRTIRKQRQANDTIRTEIQEYESQIVGMNRQIEQHKTNEDLQRLQTTMKNLSNRLSVLRADLQAEQNKEKKPREEVSRAGSISNLGRTKISKRE